MKRIIVTGGAGFIGSHLCERLIEDGHEVLCVDNFFTGRRQNIVPLLGKPYFELVRHDVTFPLYVETDEIYNLACPASPVHYQFDPVQTTKTSVHGAINMLGLAKRTKAKIFQASTSEVYGDPLQHPQREDYWGNVNPIGERSCYDEAKRFAEALCMAYAKSESLNVGVVRIFNTYGPRLDSQDGRVISNLVNQALRGDALTIYGDGTQTRSFCYVSDLINGILAMAGSQLLGPINLGNPREYSILRTAEMIIEKTKSSSVIVYQDLPSDDPQMRCPDITLAEKALSWRPSIEIDEGLDNLINWYKSQGEAK